MPRGLTAHVLTGLLIIAAGLAVHLHGLDAPFISDDFSSITDNPHIRELWPPTAWLKAPAQSSHSGRPLVGLSLAINYKISGFDVRSYHAMNIAFHLLCALVLVSLLRRCLKLPSVALPVREHADLLALAVALLWTVHPLQTETVTFVIQRTELMMSLFLLLTLYASLRSWQSEQPGAWRAAAITACFAGTLCKENMVVAPVLVLLLDRSLMSGTFTRAWREHIPLYVGLFASWIVIGIILALGPRSDSVGFGHAMGPWTYLQTQAGVILWYLRLVFWPHPLAIAYEWPIPELWTQWLVPGLAVLTLLAASLIALWRRPAAGFAAFAVFVLLAPTSSIVPITTEVIAERRMYLPLACILTLLMVGAFYVLRFRRNTLTALTAMLAVALAFGSVDRLHDYDSEITLWSHDVAQYPESYRAQNALGRALAKSGQIDQALEHFEAALAAHPTYIPARLNMATAMMVQGENARAAAMLQQVLEEEPDNVFALTNLGLMAAKTGHMQVARQFFEKALSVNPMATDAQLQLGKVLINMDEPARGLEYLNLYLQAYPQDADAHDYAGVACVLIGKPDMARKHFLAALQVDPQHAQAARHLQMLDAMK